MSLCRLHAERKPITSRIKEVTNPLQAPSFLSILEIDLMDFQNLPCTCRHSHKWVINLIDHHTKFVNSHPLHAKSADEVLDAVKNYCLSYGYPKKILTDNGGEFCNAKLKLFCEGGKSNQVVPWSAKNSNHTRSCGKKQQNMERKYEVNNYGVK